jgi:hypothetical protein
MIWANINHCPKKLSSAHADDSHGSNHANGLNSSLFTSLAQIPEEGFAPSGSIGNHEPSGESEHCKNEFEHENQYKSNIVVYADCHASSRGLFGMLYAFTDLNDFLQLFSLFPFSGDGLNDFNNRFRDFAACCCQRAELRQHGNICGWSFRSERTCDHDCCSHCRVLPNRKA